MDHHDHYLDQGSFYKRGSAKPDPLDVHIAGRLKHRRTELEIRQADIAEFLGLSIAQIQKYETGQNRISAATLYRLSYQLGVPLDWFFE